MDIWLPDPDAHIARIEGAWTDNLTSALYHAHQLTHRALGLPALDAQQVRGAYHAVALPLAKADNLGLNKAAYLFAQMLRRPREARSARDLAELAAAHWTEQGRVESQAQRSALEASLRGRVEAARAGQAAPTLADVRESEAVLWGMERAAQHAVKMKDTTRAVIAATITDALLRGDSAAQLAGTLVQRFGTLNRDARRLAITEIAFARANGFLQGVPAGEKVAWFTAAGCCPHCAKLDGREFTVTRGPGDPETEVWPGKHRVGKKDGYPAIPWHPHCRCRWRRVLSVPAGVSARTLDALKVLDD